MADVVFPIFITMSQCVISDKAGYQQKYPVDHSLRLWCIGHSEPGNGNGSFTARLENPLFNTLCRDSRPDPLY